MCKATIHMLEQLWPVLKNQQKAATATIMEAWTLKLNKEPAAKIRFFMFAATWCNNSKRAFDHIQTNILKDVEVKSEQFAVVGTDMCQYICPDTPWYNLVLKEDNLSDPLNVQLQQLLGCWDVRKRPNKTWPQVFIHIDPKWYYVGGADDTVKLKTPTVASTLVPQNLVSDQLHLLPWGREEEHNPPTQLKF